MSKRKQFDRPQRLSITVTGDYTMRDPEPIATGYKRVYTVVSACDLTTNPTKIRFGTGGEDQPKWHEEEPAPQNDVYYHTEREYHCRQQDRGIVRFYTAHDGDDLIVIWHGYDQLINER